MASATMFLGNKADGNVQVAALLKSGQKYKIVDLATKEAGGRADPVLAIKVQGYEFWIKVNKPSIKAMIAKYGDDTDRWLNKSVLIVHKPIVMPSGPTIQIDISPV